MGGGVDIVTGCILGAAFFLALGLVWYAAGQKRVLWKRKGGTRLRVLDTMVLDPRRRLVLVGRDHVQHLLLLGGPNDLVVETGVPVDRSSGMREPGFPETRPGDDRGRDFPVFGSPRDFRS
jgi:flagellar protein FliO/FliZ